MYVQAERAKWTGFLTYAELTATLGKKINSLLTGPMRNSGVMSASSLRRVCNEQVKKKIQIREGQTKQLILINLKN